MATIDPYFQCPGRIADYASIPFANEAASSNQGMVIINTGSGARQRRFQIHMALAMAVSDYFRLVFGNNAMIEAQTRMVTLDHADPDIFAMLVNWMYTRKFYREGTLLAQRPGLERGRWIGRVIRNAIKAYLLAEYLAMPACLNDLMDVLRYVQATLHVTALGPGLDITIVPDHSTFYKYLRDNFAYELAESYGTWQHQGDRRHRALLDSVSGAHRRGLEGIFPRSLEIAASWTSLAEQQASLRPIELAGCVYHSHNGVISNPPY